MKRKLPLLAAIAAMAAVCAFVIPSALAAVWTDQADYAPGSVVTIHGDNSNMAAGMGYQSGEPVHVDVSGPSGYSESCDATADSFGAWSCSVTLNADDSAVGSYSYTATGMISGTQENGTFTDGNQNDTSPITVDWTGHGTTNGACDTVGPADDLNPQPGQQGWLFILTSPFDGNGSTLTYSFSDGTQSPPTIVGTFESNGQGGSSYHYAVYTAIGATLLSASATNGTSQSNLNVSHCEVNKFSSSVSTTIVLDSNGNPVTGTPPTVDAGTAVHDTATVTGAGPTPTGSVTFTLHVGSDCTGAAVAGQTTTGNLNNSGVAASGAFTPSTSGDWSYSAHYNGDQFYSASDLVGCEPLHANPSVPPAANLTISKDAAGSYTDTYKWTPTKSAGSDTVYTAGGADGSADYTVTVSHDGGTISLVTVTGTITVNNPNSDSVAINGITDQLSDGTVCNVSGGGAQTLDATSSTPFSYSCNLGSTLPSAPLTNKAVVSWDTQSLPDYQPLAGGSADTGDVSVGTFTANNVDFCTTVTDTIGGGTTLGDACANGDWTTDSGNHLDNFDEGYSAPTFTLTYTGTVSGKAGTCTDNKNTASATGDDSGTKVDSNEVTVSDCQGSDLSVTKDATPSFDRTYTWSLDKSVDKKQVYSAGGGASDPVTYTVNASHDAGTDSNWQVNGKIHVQNSNDWEAITLDSTNGLVDSIDNGGTCTVDTSGGLTIPASSTVDFPYSCTYASAPSPSSFTNTATANWDSTTYHTPTGTDSGTAKGDFSTATPNIIDGSFTVTDPAYTGGSPAGTLGTATYTDPSPKQFQFQVSFTDPTGTCTPHDNTASGTTDTSGTEVDSNKVTVSDCQGSDLSVTKDATPSFTRTFGWSITKVACLTGTGGNTGKACVTVDKLTGGGTATFNYTVQVKHDPGTDSNWQVNGKIHVQNSNDWEAITLDSTNGLVDSIDNGGTCTVDTSGGLTIPASSTVDFPYSCTYASAPSPSSFTNTATANWDSTTYHTPTGTDSGTAKGSFGDPTTLKDRCFTATDTFNGGSAVTLGVACINPTSWTKDAGNNLANFAESFTDPTFTFTYTRTINAPAVGTCVTYPNTARFTTKDTGSTGSAGASVQVCNYNAALTIGYWGNHLAPNGTSGCSGLPNGTGCSANGPWANQFLPQSLGGYSVNTFQKVASVIAANSCSNASSSSQNAVGCLAAQLLAAELNVGNKSDPCIVTVADGINDANKWLSSGTVDGVPGINYTGPSGNYSGITAGQRAEALVLKNKLVNYNQGGGC